MKKQLVEKLTRIATIFIFWLSIGASIYLAKYSNVSQGVLWFCWICGVSPYLVYIKFIRHWRGTEHLDYTKKGVKPL